MFFITNYKLIHINIFIYPNKDDDHIKSIALKKNEGYNIQMPQK